MTKTIANRYRLQEELGAGGMGRVYSAYDRLIGDTVALKQVLIGPENLQFESWSSEQNLKLALAEEFQTLAGLRHPHIISVLDYGFDQAGQPFFTMTLLKSPQTVLAFCTHLELPQRLHILVQIAQALTYLHRRDVVHRDLKPSNVLVTDGVVQVLDFGLAGAHATNGIAGTPAYMAPELFRGQPATKASDMYAVGVIAYEMLAGAPPFKDMNFSEFLRATLDDTPDVAPLQSALGMLPQQQSAQLIGVVERLLSKRPQDRYADGGELVQALLDVGVYQGPAETDALREGFLQGARFIGRKHELEQLTVAVLNLTDDRRHGSLWLIGGESGVGKSRLLNEIRTIALVNGVLVTRDNSVSDGGQAYQVWQQTLSWLVLQGISDTEASILKPVVDNIERLTERAIPDAATIDPIGIRERFASTVIAILRRLERPLLILLEDIHWMDQESLTLLKRIAEEIDTLPVIIMASYRDDEVLDFNIPQAQKIRLKRLTPRETAALGAAMLGHDATTKQHVTAFLERETEGNAFFIVEVVRALAEEAGGLRNLSDFTLPQRIIAGGVQAVLRRRLARVPQSAQALLRLMSVIGREIDVKLLRELAAGQDIDSWLVDVANVAVIDVLDNRWRFSHDKLREYILDDIPAEEAARLHRNVALAIESVYADDKRYTAALARHWRLAGDPDNELRYAFRAGQQAHAISDYDGMNAHFQRALVLLEARTDPESLTTRGEITLTLGDVARRQGNYHDAERYLQASNALSLQTGNTAQLALGLVYQGVCYAFIRSTAEAVQRIEAGLVLARQQDDPLLLLEALSWYAGELTAGRSDFERALPIIQEGMALSRQVGSTVHQIRLSYVWAGYLSAQQRFAEAQQLLDNAIRIARVHSDLYELANCLGTKASLLVENKTSDKQQVKALVLECIEIERKIKHVEGECFSMVLLLNLSDDPAEKKNYIRDILALAHKVAAALQLNLIGEVLNTMRGVLPPAEHAAILRYTLQHPAIWADTHALHTETVRQIEAQREDGAGQPVPVPTDMTIASILKRLSNVIASQ